MIHDATGKFSSRWVFPDRSSLALVIKRTGYIHQDWRHAPTLGACDGIATPYRGIRRQNQCYLGSLAHTAAPVITPESGRARRSRDAKAAYCPWFFSTWSQAGVILGRFC